MKKIILSSEHGGFLIGALVFVVILGIVIFSVATLVTNQNRSQVQNANERIAFYAAEAGAEYAIAVLKDSSDWREGINDEPLAEGKFSVSLSDVGDTLIITSTGKVENTQKNVQVLLLKMGAPDMDYSVLAGDEIDFSKGEAVVNGNLHANKKVKIGEKYTINGTITQAPPVIDLPEVDWDFFRNEAIAQGQYVEGDKSFVISESPYSGVWYATGKAKMQDNDIVVNGTIVSEKNCELTKNNEKITATPSNYPAIATMGDLIVDKNNVEINGLIYCKNLVIKKNNMVINGAIITTGTIKNEKNNTILNFEPKYLTKVEGVDFGKTSSKGDSLIVLRWQN